MAGESKSNRDWPKPTIEDLVDEFKAFCPNERIHAFQDGIRTLIGAGIETKDIADALYSSPSVLDAVTDGNYDHARKLIAKMLEGYRAEIGRFGLSDSVLRALDENGISVGEVAWALRNIGGLSDELASSNFDDAARWAEFMHKLYMRGGRGLH